MSPYNALPGNADVLGLQVRPKTAHFPVPSAPVAEGVGRAVYVRAPRPPGALREYAPLRPRAQSGQAQGNGKAWQEDSEGDETDYAVCHQGRPTSAHISMGQPGARRKQPPLSARGRMQSVGAPDSRADALSRRASAGGQDRESIYEDYSPSTKTKTGAPRKLLSSPRPTKLRSYRPSR